MQREREIRESAHEQLLQSASTDEERQAIREKQEALRIKAEETMDEIRK